MKAKALNQLKKLRKKAIINDVISPIDENWKAPLRGFKQMSVQEVGGCIQYTSARKSLKAME